MGGIWAIVLALPGISVHRSQADVRCSFAKASPTVALRTAASQRDPREHLHPPPQHSTYSCEMPCREYHLLPASYPLKTVWILRQVSKARCNLSLRHLPPHTRSPPLWTSGAALHHLPPSAVAQSCDTLLTPLVYLSTLLHILQLHPFPSGHLPA